MKKNKKRLLIGTLILFVVWSCVTVFIIFKDNKNIVINKELGILSVSTIDNINIKIGNDFYIKDEGKKLVVYDFNNNVISEYLEEFTNYELFLEKYIVITNKNFKKIIDKYGNVLAKGGQVKKARDDKYILVDNALYDKDMNRIYTLDFTGNFEFTADISNDLLIVEAYQKGSKSIIVDIKEEKVLYRDFENSTYYVDNNKLTYFRFTKDNKGYLFDTRTKEILYEDITYDNESYVGYNTFMYKDNIYYIDDDVIYGDTSKIDKKYVMSKDTCDIGYKLKNKDGKVVIDKCMYAYKVLFDNAILGINNEENILFYKDKEISGGLITLEGDYIKVADAVDLLGDGTTYKYYDKTLKQLDIDENTDISYVTKGVYQSYNYFNYEYYFLDKDLKKYSDKLFGIDCNNNGYCNVYKNNNEHYLYKDGKKVSDDVFVSINISDKKIILESLYKTYVLTLGENKVKKLDFNAQFNINLDDIIKKYDLKDIEFKINKNEELFKKFAFIVENNNMLLGYKKEVYDLFEIVVDNKKYLDEFYFLHKLGYLNILDAEELENGKAAGTYEDYATRINLVSDTASVLYHELIHFVDFSFNNKTSTTLYKCGDKIDVYDAVPNIPDGCDYISVNFTNYITEAGAEAFTTKYFTKRINAYNFGTYYLDALEYIYGTDEVNKWYFGDDNYFIKVLYDEYGDEEKVMHILDALSDTTSLNMTYKYTGELLDILVDLYKKNNGEDYLNDKKFVLLLRPMLDFMNADNSKYYKEIHSLDINLDFLNSIKDEVDYECFSSFVEPFIMNDKMYISWYAWDISVSRSAVIYIDYDFNKKEIKDYKLLEE